MNVWSDNTGSNDMSIRSEVAWLHRHYIGLIFLAKRTLGLNRLVQYTRARLDKLAHMIKYWSTKLGQARLKSTEAGCFLGIRL